MSTNFMKLLELTMEAGRSIVGTPKSGRVFNGYSTRVSGQHNLGGPPPVTVTIKANKNYIWVLLYS